MNDNFSSQIPVEIKGQQEPQKLSQSAIAVLNLIRKHTLNKKSKVYFNESRRSIATILNAGQSTVSKALDALLKAKLITKKRGITGKNENVRDLAQLKL